jgi:hypothetical protein
MPERSLNVYCSPLRVNAVRGFHSRAFFELLASKSNHLNCVPNGFRQGCRGGFVVGYGRHSPTHDQPSGGAASLGHAGRPVIPARLVLGFSFSEQSEPLVSLRTGALGSISRALGGLMLFGGITGLPGPLASLGVLLGEFGCPLQCVGQLRQDAGGRLGRLSRMTRDEVSSAYFAVGRVRID